MCIVIYPFSVQRDVSAADLSVRIRGGVLIVPPDRHTAPGGSTYVYIYEPRYIGVSTLLLLQFACDKLLHAGTHG